MKLLATFLLFLSLTANAELWYQPNNVGVAGGLPVDFSQSVNSPNQWNEALKNIDVYYLRLSSARKANPADLVKLAQILKRYNIKTAIDTPSATWANCRNGRDYSRDILNIQELISVGFDVQYIGLQSVLSKPYKNNDGMCNEYRTTLSSNIIPRYIDLLTYFQQVQPQFPNIKIGLIDALIAKESYYKIAYRDIANGLVHRGYKLGFVHIDLPIKYYPTQVSYSQLTDLSRYLTSLNVSQGMFVVSSIGGRGGVIEASNRKVEGLLKLLRNGVNYTDWISGAWYPHPAKSLPDSDLYSDLGTINRLNTVLKAWGK